MAHFAKVDENNLVTEVIVIDNAVVDPEGKGNDNETLGQTYIADVLGLEGNWQQCSYNNNIRGNYAGIGYTYDETNDVFIPPKPYASWTINESTWSWDSPVEYPSDGKQYLWNEENLRWDLNE